MSALSRLLVGTGAAGRTGAGIQVESDLAFDRVMALLGAALVVGVHIDGWAHNHNRVDQSFFTPWHAILYGAFFVVALFTFFTVFNRRRQGDAWSQALPAGYRLTLWGVVLFGLGGVGDMTWHILFGIEKSVDALYSPTHLLLFVSGVLIAAGPLRAAWARGNAESGWRQEWPALLSLLSVLSILTFVSQPFHPFGFTTAANPPAFDGEMAFYRQALGVAAILIQSALLVGLVLTFLTRMELPVGSMTAILTLNALLVLSQNGRDEYFLLPAAMLAGIGGDVLLLTLRPAWSKPRAWHAFAFAVPALVYFFYFLDLAVTRGVWWSIHLSAGSIFLAGIVGYLVSYGLRLCTSQSNS